MSHSLGRSLVTEDVDLTGTATDSTRAKIVDVTIPTGKVVVGSGSVITHVSDGSSNNVQTIDSLSTWQQSIKSVASFDGPHPTDATLWRFIVRSMDTNGYGYATRLRVWLVAVDPD